MGYNNNPLYLERRPREVKNAYCSADLARKKFNYSTTITLEKSLKKLIRYIQDSPKRKFKYFLDLEIRSELTPKSWSKKLFLN